MDIDIGIELYNLENNQTQKQTETPREMKFKTSNLTMKHIGVFFLVKICGVLQGPFSAPIFDPAAVLRRKIFMISAQIFQILKFLRRFYKKNLRNTSK